MAKSNDTSKSRPRGKRSSKAQATSSPPKPAKATASLESPEDIVEDERARLMKAHSILSCMITAMEDADVCTGDGPYWPAVIETACDLIDESIRRLEDLDYSSKPKGYEVRERAPGFGDEFWAHSSSLLNRGCEDAPGHGAFAPLLKTH